MAEEKGKRSKKEYEGEKFLKAARDDIVKLNKVLLKKQLESQDIKSEVRIHNNVWGADVRMSSEFNIKH